MAGQRPGAPSGPVSGHVGVPGVPRQPLKRRQDGRPTGCQDFLQPADAAVVSVFPVQVTVYRMRRPCKGQAGVASGPVMAARKGKNPSIIFTKPADQAAAMATGARWPQAGRGPDRNGVIFALYIPGNLIDPVFARSGTTIESAVFRWRRGKGRMIRPSPVPPARQSRRSRQVPDMRVCA